VEANSKRHELHLKEYLYVLRNRLWVILTTVFIIVTIVTIVSYRLPKIYRSSATLQLEWQGTTVVPVFEGVYEPVAAYDYNNYFETQYRLLQSRNVSSMVLEDPEFAVLPVFAGEKDPVAKLRKMIQVQPIKNSQLVHVAVEDKDPRAAAALANRVVECYIDYNNRRRETSSVEALLSLKRELERMQPEVDDKADAVRAFKAAHGLVSLEDKTDIAYSRLAKLNDALTEAEQRRISLEARYEAPLTVSDDAASEDRYAALEGNELVTSLRKLLAERHQELSTLSEKYGEKHPKLAELKQKIVALKEELETEGDRCLRAGAIDYEAALAEEAALAKSLEAQKKVVAELGGKIVKLERLKAAQERTERIYDELLQRVREIDITKDSQRANITIVDAAEVPVKPVRPKPLLNIALALLAGLCSGIGLALFAEYLDTTIKRPEDVEETLGVPVLGFVPIMNRSTATAEGLRHKELIAHVSRRSSISEAYRDIRNSVNFSSYDKEIKTVVVTSPGIGDGKTTLATNLAISFAQSGRRVLLVDADLHRSRLHRIFDISNETGLGDVLADGTSPRDAIVASQVHNLDVLPSGPAIEDPSELIQSEKLRRVLADLQEDYDTIIIDGPPVLLVSEGSILGGCVDAVIPVLTAARHSRHTAHITNKRLRAAKANIIGIVLNFVNPRRDASYYGSYRHYYRYKGYDDSHDGNGKDKKQDSREPARALIMKDDASGGPS